MTIIFNTRNEQSAIIITERKLEISLESKFRKSRNRIYGFMRLLLVKIFFKLMYHISKSNKMCYKLSEMWSFKDNTCDEQLTWAVNLSLGTWLIVVCSLMLFCQRFPLISSVIIHVGSPLKPSKASHKSQLNLNDSTRILQLSTCLEHI